MILRYVFTFLTFVYFINCSGNLNKDEISNQDEFSSPEIQFTQAMLMFDNQQYEVASNKFKNIERIYPLSNEAIQSQIMQGFINYILLDYDTAIFQFSRIINKYPSLKNIDYVYYMKALCYYEQISHRTGQRKLSHPIWPRTDPEMSFRSDHPGQIPIQCRKDFFRDKWLALPIYIAAHAIFFGFGHMIRKPIKLFGPHRMLMGFIKIK